MGRKVVYTAIFGSYDNLLEPKYIPEGWDFVCFTDTDLKSDVWKVVKVPAVYNDPTRNARRYKLLPHKWFPEYDVSIWIDGNFGIQGDVNKAVEVYLANNNMAIFDHTKVWDNRDCIYQEAQAIFYLGQKNKGSYKDDPDVIKVQMEKYIAEGYPANNGLIVSGILFRRHNKQDVIDTMNLWWEEVKYNSKRDQLSFNYAAWRTGIQLYWLDHDIRENTYFFHPGKHPRNKKSNYAPISLDYFLNMELANGRGGKEIIKQDGRLSTVLDIVEYFSDKTNRDKISATLTPENWQYYNCMMAQFRRNVGNHHDVGWANMTQDYYNNLELMTDPELEEFLKSNPVEFDNGFIRHNYHRACAMIGRLIAGKSYIPFYMKTSQIYDEPRKKDNNHRVKPLTTNVYGIKQILDLGIPTSEFTITQSGILALMGIRKNDDIDIIISSKIRSELFNNTSTFIKLPGDIEIFEPNRRKLLDVAGTSDDDLIANHSLIVDGIRFLYPRFYLSRKRVDRESDKRDWDEVCEFLQLENYKGYPFNTITSEQWGVKYVTQYMENR